MGKASSRKRPFGDLAAAAPHLPSPANDARIAAQVLEAEALLRDARKLCESLADAMERPKVNRFFKRLAVALGDVERSFGPSVVDAQVMLGRAVDLVGRGADGSRVALASDGVVQHSAPDHVVRELVLHRSRSKEALH